MTQGKRPELRLNSAVELAAWPAVVSGFAAELMALLRQLDDTQWWPAEKLRAQQFRQLQKLVAHAAREVPFHAQRLKAAGIDPAQPLTETAWARLPVLTRREVQEQGEKLHAKTPEALGRVTETASGGSTGVPVRVRKTALDQLMWNAMHAREELWHRDDALGTIARIRGFPPPFTAEQRAAMEKVPGLTLPNWGPPTTLLWQTGKMGLVTYRMAIPEQIKFLQQLKPQYILTNPANLRLLLSHAREQKVSIPTLLSVWTVSEVVDDSLREACQSVFGCRIVHNYTAGETGYLGLQCPEHATRFHVMSESVLLEVVDAGGRACGPGEVGRVLVTPLHNFAMPLLRYEIGDEAEPGAPCSCGRGLPVLNRIVGRIVDCVRLPSGAQRRVDTAHSEMSKIPAIREFQLVQRSVELVEVLLVVSRPLTDEERNIVTDRLRSQVGSEFRFEIVYRDEIARTPEGKLRTFLCEVPAPG